MIRIIIIIKIIRIRMKIKKRRLKKMIIVFVFYCIVNLATLRHVVEPVSVVMGAIRVLDESVTMPLPHAPLAPVRGSLERVVIRTQSVDLVLSEVPFVVTAITKRQPTLSFGGQGCVL